MEHQSPVILITSSEGEDGGTDDKRGLRSEEYRILADLTGFDNLRTMLETERAHGRSKKRKRKTKKKKTICYGAQGEVFDAREKELADEVFAPESSKVFGVNEEELADEVSAPESSMISSNIDASTNIDVDAGREKEQVDGVEAVETAQALKGYGVVKSSAIIDLCSSSTEDDQVEVNMRCCRAAKELVPADTLVLKKRKKRRRKKGKMNKVHEAGNVLIPLLQSQIGVVSQKKKDKSGGTVMSFRADPIGSLLRERKDKHGGAMMSFRTDPVGSVLQKLLRGPRYFDPPRSSPDECLRCGEIHVTRNCTTAYRKRPCSLCAGYGHSWKRCPQGMNCFSCKGRGHRDARCPEKKQGGHQFSEICLRCGESGHHMTSCRTNYSPDDLKEIQCYVCKSFGHLCCAEFKDPAPGCISCYNCGHSGHLGSNCTVPHGNARAVTCSKPQEEGHSTSGVAICLKRMEEEDNSASRVATSSKHKAEHSGSRSADSLLHTNAFTPAHIASACSTFITPADSLLPEQRFGDSSTLAQEIEICEGSNSMPKNLDEARRKNKSAICSKRKEEDNSASRVATCSKGNRNAFMVAASVCSPTITPADTFATRSKGNRNAFTLAASVCSPTITPADTFATCSKGNKNAFTLATSVWSPTITPADTFATCSKGNRNAFTLETSVCSPTITPADTFATCSKGNRNAFTLAASVCSPTITPADTFATCSKGNRNAFTLAASVCSPTITPADTFATCSKGKEEGHFAGRWVDYLRNRNAFTLAASVCSPAITPVNTSQPERRLGDSLATTITID